MRGGPSIRVPAAGLLLVMLAGCATRSAERPPVEFTTTAWTFEKTAGHQLTTPHYEIYTTLPDDLLLKALPDLVEAAYSHYRTLVPAAGDPPERLPVYLFATRGQWADYTRKLTGPRARVFLQVRNGGYSEDGVSVIQYVAHQTTFPILAHEGLHQYLFVCVGPNVPAWINEGLATLCEGQRWSGARFERFDPWFNPLRRNDLAEALQEKRLYSLRNLLETNAGQVVQGTSRGISTYYAQVWALMLFLREGEKGKYAPAFDRLLRDLAGGAAEQRARAAHIWSESETYQPGEALFRAYIAEDVAAVDREYVAFMRDRVLGKMPVAAK